MAVRRIASRDAAATRLSNLVADNCLQILDVISGARLSVCRSGAVSETG
jgi:hypothetical protein